MSFILLASLVKRLRFLLAAVAGLWRRAFIPCAALWLNRLSGGVIFAFGVAAILSAFALISMR